MSKRSEGGPSTWRWQSQSDDDAIGDRTPTSASDESWLAGLAGELGQAPAGLDREVPADLDLPDLELLDRVGEGGFGVVYLARHQRLNIPVAVKLLWANRTSDDERTRFRREAQLLARIDHPNVLRVFELGEAVGQLYIVSEWMDGGAVQSPVAGEKRWLEVAASVAGALRALAAAGIVHRDVKPGNILCRSDGRIKLADLGVAVDGQMTTDGRLIGTLPFMAPELLRAETPICTGQTDLYALGVSLFELWTGRNPFRGGTPAAIMQSILYDEPEIPEGLSPGAAALLRDLMAKDPAERVADPDALLERLRDLAQRPVEVAALRPVEPRRRARWPWVSLVAALSLLAVGALVRRPSSAPISAEPIPLTVLFLEGTEALDALDVREARAELGPLLLQVLAATPRAVLFDLRFVEDSGLDPFRAALDEAARQGVPVFASTPRPHLERAAIPACEDWPSSTRCFAGLLSTRRPAGNPLDRWSACARDGSPTLAGAAEALLTGTWRPGELCAHEQSLQVPLRLPAGEPPYLTMTAAELDRDALAAVEGRVVLVGDRQPYRVPGDPDVRRDYWLVHDAVSGDARGVSGVEAHAVATWNLHIAEADP